MALPPTIPTSFVPRSGAAPRRGGIRIDFAGAFGLLSFALLFIAIVLAVGVFLYGQLLNRNLATKQAELAKEQAKIDSSLAESFVKLDNRLTAATTLLDNHTKLSQYFDAISVLLPVNVRFTSMQVTVVDSKKVTVEASGVAKNFNALAYASSVISKSGKIKDAIFSRMTVNKDNSVSFGLSATIDPELITEKRPAPQAPAAVTDEPIALPAATSTATSTPTAPAPAATTTTP